MTEDDDWTQYTDVKEKYPDKLKELQDLFVTEAQKNNVFPLNNTPLAINARTSLIGTRSTTVYHPGIVALVWGKANWRGVHIRHTWHKADIGWRFMLQREASLSSIKTFA